MENEVIINKSEDNNTITFQAKGEVDFLEHITRVVLKEFNNSDNESDHSVVKAYDLQNGYIGETIDINKDDSNNSNVPEHFITGIKHFDDGNEKFRCRYICPECNTKENKYIEKYFEYIYCRSCNNKLYVDWVEDNYNKEHDSFNNFAYAGKYKPIFNE